MTHSGVRQVQDLTDRFNDPQGCLLNMCVQHCFSINQSDDLPVPYPSTVPPELPLSLSLRCAYLAPTSLPVLGTLNNSG